MARSEDVKTPEARLSFADGLWELQVDDKGNKSWTCSLLWPKSIDLGALKTVAAKACEEEWPGKSVAWLKDGTIKNPFLDGDGKQGRSKKTGEAHPGYPGHTFIRCKSGEAYRPKLVDKKVLPITSKDGCYSGCYGFAVVNAYTWDNKEQGKGVSFGISMFQVAKDGERLGGGGAGNPEEYFETLPDEGAAPEKTKDGAGAGGLFG